MEEREEIVMPDPKPKNDDRSFAELVVESKRLQEAAEEISARMDQLAKQLKQRTEEFERQELSRQANKNDG